METGYIRSVTFAETVQYSCSQERESYTPDSSQGSEATQCLHDPHATQFMSTQAVNWPALGPAFANPRCEYDLVCDGLGTESVASVTSNMAVFELCKVNLKVVKPLHKPDPRMDIELVYDGICPSTWRSVEIMCLTQVSFVSFAKNLSLAYVGLAETSLRLEFEGSHKLKATMTNTLLFPVEHQVMLFHCVRVD